MVSPSLEYFYLFKFGWLGHVGARIEFAVIAAFYLSDFVWLGRVGDNIEFVVLVLFLVSRVWARLECSVLVLSFVYFPMYFVPFILFLYLSLSYSLALDSCWGTDFL